MWHSCPYVFFKRGSVQPGANPWTLPRPGPLTIFRGIMHIMHQHSHFLLMSFIASNQYLQYKSKYKFSKMNISNVKLLNDLVNDTYIF